MPTEAQVAANQENSQKSTGPTSAEGKARICLNAFRHGLAGAFMILPDEVRDDFDELHEGLRSEHKPETPTEILLIESMAQHYWLKQRALRLQTSCFDMEEEEGQTQLALYLRYQTTHDRAFHKALNTLLKLRSDKWRARLDEAAFCQRAEDSNKIGFVSQEAKLNGARGVRSTSASALQQAAAEKRREELHKWKVLRAQAEVDHRILLNMNRATPEHPITVGPQHIRDAEKAA